MLVNNAYLVIASASLLILANASLLIIANSSLLIIAKATYLITKPHNGFLLSDTSPLLPQDTASFSYNFFVTNHSSLNYMFLLHVPCGMLCRSLLLPLIGILR